MIWDRGIDGDEVFERVLADPYLQLITSEKGFVAEPTLPESWKSVQPRS